eukprot:352374-Chlamydomonas_euryale.AAC.9
MQLSGAGRIVQWRVDAMDPSGSVWDVAYVAVVCCNQSHASRCTHALWVSTSTSLNPHRCTFAPSAVVDGSPRAPAAAVAAAAAQTSLRAVAAGATRVRSVRAGRLCSTPHGIDAGSSVSMLAVLSVPLRPCCSSSAVLPRLFHATPAEARARSRSNSSSASRAAQSPPAARELPRRPTLLTASPAGVETRAGAGQRAAAAVPSSAPPQQLPRSPPRLRRGAKFESRDGCGGAMSATALGRT